MLTLELQCFQWDHGYIMHVFFLLFIFKIDLRVSKQVWIQIMSDVLSCLSGFKLSAKVTYQHMTLTGKELIHCILLTDI